MSRVIMRIRDDVRPSVGCFLGVPDTFEASPQERLQKAWTGFRKRIRASADQFEKWLTRYRGPDRLSNCSALVEICGYLSYQDIVSCMSINRRIRSVILNHAEKFQKEQITLSIHKHMSDFDFRLNGVTNPDYMEVMRIRSSEIRSSEINSEQQTSMRVNGSSAADAFLKFTEAVRQLFGFSRIDITLTSELNDSEVLAIRKLLGSDLFGISPIANLVLIGEPMWGQYSPYHGYLSQQIGMIPFDSVLINISLQWTSHELAPFIEGWLEGAREVRLLEIHPIDIAVNEDTQNEWINLCYGLESKYDLVSPTSFHLTRSSDGNRLSFEYTVSNHYLDVKLIISMEMDSKIIKHITKRIEGYRLLTEKNQLNSENSEKPEPITKITKKRGKLRRFWSSITKKFRTTANSPTQMLALTQVPISRNFTRMYDGPDLLSNCAVFVEICSYFSTEDMISCLSVNRRIQSIIRNNPSRLQRKESIILNIHKKQDGFYVRLKGVKNPKYEENIYINNGIIKSGLPNVFHNKGHSPQKGDNSLESDRGVDVLVVECPDSSEAFQLLTESLCELFSFDRIDIMLTLELSQYELESIRKLLRADIFNGSPIATLLCLNNDTYHAYLSPDMRSIPFDSVQVITHEPWRSSDMIAFLNEWFKGTRFLNYLAIQTIDGNFNLAGNLQKEIQWINLCNAMESKYDRKWRTCFNLTRPSDGETLCIDYTISNHHLIVKLE